MGIKSVFKKKEPTEEELREHLSTRGISTKSGKGQPRQEKFGAFKQYAQDRANAKPGLAPVNPYANINQQEQGNPYANNGEGEGGNPYGDNSNGGGDPYSQGSNPYSQGSNPYSQGSNPHSQGPSHDNPYAQQRQSPYERRGSSRPSRPAGPDPYSNQSLYSNREDTRSIASQRTRGGRDFDEESLDLNAIPSNQMYQSKKPVRRMVADDETLDLNDVPEEDDLNVVIDEELPEEQEVNSEDEEIEAIKQDIRFVKQESVALTRNTLRMAQEADASGTNTLGMMGSQSERLYNSEQNLNLADTQSKIAEEKVKQIQRLNRSIFIPASGNPFNKKSRLRMQEQKIKTDKAQEKYLRDNNRRNMYESEQRIKQGITNGSTSSDTYNKYQGEKDLKAAERYQFENDLEDDEMEKELASNLDQISLYSKKLKNSAKTMGDEVDVQNSRLRKIEEDSDKLDINVHLNNTRLNNIR